jgi:hypothetical protein
LLLERACRRLAHIEKNARIEKINIPKTPIAVTIPSMSSGDIAYHLLYASSFSDVATYSKCRLPRAAEKRLDGKDRSCYDER